MSIMPSKALERIQFFEDHIDVWTAHAGSIGTTAQAVTALQAKVQAARDAYDAQQAAYAAARAATETYHQALDEMQRAGSAIVDAIHVAAKHGGSGVYPLAQIAPPSPPSPVGPPGECTNFTVHLQADGALELRWKCRHPPGCKGVIYRILRRIDDGPFEQVGDVGMRRFVDSTVPAGASRITYQIQGVRSASAGPWSQFNVNFGVKTAGTASEPLTQGRKRAA